MIYWNSFISGVSNIDIKKGAGRPGKSPGCSTSVPGHLHPGTDLLGEGEGINSNMT